MPTKTRKAKVAANVRAWYSRADYVTPHVALDRAQTKALRAYMKREGLGVGDAIRSAIMATATAGKKPATTKRSLVKSRAPARPAGTQPKRASRPG